MNRSRRFFRMLKKNFRRRYAKTYSGPDVRPVSGCILKCDLGILLEHTGVYIGRNKIVSLNRRSEIKVETPVSFFPPGTNPKSSRIYAACFGATDELLGTNVVSKRAKERINQTTEYNVLFNNCHRFTTGCITGNFENDVMSFTQLEDVILANIDSLRRKKPWWKRLADFVLRRKEPDEPPSFNWRPVIF